MKITKKNSGLVFNDQLTSLSNWVPTSPTNISVGTGMVVTHNNAKDVRVLRTIPPGAKVFELAIDYTSSAAEDAAGVILYTSDTNYIEIIESFDESQAPVTDYKIIHRDGVWDVFALRDERYEFVTSSVEQFTKFGVVVKKGLTTYQNLKLLQVVAARNPYLVFTSLPPGAILEVTKDGATVTETAVDGVVRYEMAHTEETLTVRLLTEDNEEMYNVTQLFAMGDEYFASSELELLKDGVAMTMDKDNEIGSIVGNIIEKKLELRNPLAYQITNIAVQIGEYIDKEGYLFADVALNANGAPGTYSDELKIEKLDAKASVFFWFKFDKTNDTEGLNSLYSFVKISHD